MSTEIVEVAAAARAAQADVIEPIPVRQAVERYQALVRFAREGMRAGVDYGVIPGTGGKPTLLKPGAEKLCTFFALHVEDPELVERVEDWSGAGHGGEPFFYYLVRQRLTRGGVVIAAQLASANSWEKKYRWRQQERKCPRCSAEAIRFSKDRPEWYCWRKAGGCGATFPKDDAAIAGQKPGRIANPDIFDQVNTVLKIACKRSLVSAVLVAVNASEFYTQDFDDDDLPSGGETVEAGPATWAPERQPGEDDAGALPAPGKPFLDWVEGKNREATAEGLCAPGYLRELLVKEALEKHPKVSRDPGTWKPAGVAWAVGRVEEVLRQYRALRGEEEGERNS